MREMVLNHASISAPAGNRDLVVDWLRGMVAGMAQIARDRVARTSLRMRWSLHDTLCFPSHSLFDAYQDLRRAGAREEYQFLIRLVTKIPLLAEVEPGIKDRFHACEERTLPTPQGEPLVLCAIADGIAVGFPSDPIWDRDRLTVRFDELLPDESFKEVSEQIDSLTRAVHARPICDRHRIRFRAVSSPGELWLNRHVAFPHLTFGPYVRNNLERSAAVLPTIIGKLTDLDKSVEEWRSAGGPAPRWRTKVTRESRRVRDDPALIETRRFPSQRGVQKLFEWHARYGDSGRIHLRFDARSRVVEIGYIGPHLPL